MVSPGWYCSWCFFVVPRSNHQLKILLPSILWIDFDQAIREEWNEQKAHESPEQIWIRCSFKAFGKESPTNTSILVPGLDNHTFSHHDYRQYASQEPRWLGFHMVFTCLVLGMGTDVFCMAMAESWPPIVVQVRMWHIVKSPPRNSQIRA